jgi:hypothetical protein
VEVHRMDRLAGVEEPQSVRATDERSLFGKA